MNFCMARIVTDDVAALTAFYEQLTGSTASGYDDYQEVATIGSTIAICSRQSVTSWGIDATFTTGTRTIIELVVDDVDAQRRRLDGLATEWVMEPTDQPWGNRSAILRDPDGNLVNLFTPPK